MITKPVLFHDIDGVLFGHYDGHFQLRPGVHSWLHWAHGHFDVVWLTSWTHARVEALLDLLYLRAYLPARCANWHAYQRKSLWFIEAVEKLHGREWYWLDDELDQWQEDLHAAGLALDHCLAVSPTGRDSLLEVQHRLTVALTNPR